MRTILTTLLVAGFAAAAAGQDLPDGVGTFAPSGSVFTSVIGPVALDTDDYVFQGYPGMVVTATVKSAKGSGFLPLVQIIRPGGSLVGDGNRLTLKTSPSSASARVTLDTVGWWKVRVLGQPTQRDDYYHNVTARSSGGYSVSIRYTNPAVPPLPQPTKSFKASAAISEIGESDEFPFAGYNGQSLKVTLTVSKSSTLDPQIQLLRPDGQVAATAGHGDQEKKLAIDFDLDASGTWLVRVIGEETNPTDSEHNDATLGAYSLGVKLGKTATTGLVPDANGQYRLEIPATGSARIGYRLNFKGASPTFNSMIDPQGRLVTVPAGTTLSGFVLAKGLPQGNYVVTFNSAAGDTAANDASDATTNVSFSRSLVLPKGEKKRVAKLSDKEPVIRANQINPTAGGPGTILSVQANNLIDDNNPTGPVGLFLGHLALENVELQPDQVTVRGTVPATLPEGVFDVVVTSSAGQAAARADAFTRVPPPVATDIDPAVGTDGGGFEVTIVGSNFRAGQMAVLLDGALQPLTPTFVDDTHVTFIAPPRSPGQVTFGVKDVGTQLVSNLPVNSFEYVASAGVGRIVPALIPIVGSEKVTIQGANFESTDRVYLETTVSGVYEEITATQTTFVNSKRHQFVAPTRPKGVYRVYVQNDLGQPDPPKTRPLTYYSFADITAATNLGSLGADKYDAWASAIGDFDKANGNDVFVCRRGGDVPSATSLTRVLKNNGSGQFTDVTASVMPPAGDDDWRADRIWVTDVNQDGWVDILICTDSRMVPPDTSSHTRILVNEQRGASDPTDRVFRDRTLDIMAPPRTMQLYGYFGGKSDIYVSDNWRALDMWVGDIDRGAAGPPEILITKNETTDDDNPNDDVFQSGVYCGNYCSSVQYFAYSYTFYWGGSRLLVWDKSKRGGQGQYKFDPNFFPRFSGPVVPQTGVPGGGTIPACSPHYNSICKHAFTPFTGKRLAVGNIDADGKPDVAVLSDQVVTRLPEPHSPLTAPEVEISSLQVGLNKSSGGYGITDMTDTIASLGGDTKGDCLAIGQPGFPDGNSQGVITVSRFAGSGGPSVMRLLMWRPLSGPGTFDDVTYQLLPSPDVNENFQASRIVYVDMDQDGDQDMVLVANAAPGGTRTALRILRNENVNGQVGVFRRTLEPLFQAATTANEHFEGDALAVGDVTGDGLLDYVVSRVTPVGSGAQTRVVKTDR
jgi:IPT/TIG domain-containing protein